MFGERFRLCARATADANLFDVADEWDRFEMRSRLNAGADDRKRFRVIACKQLRRER